MKGKDINIKESELIRGIKAGDNDSFRYLVEKFQSKVIRTCMAFVHSETDAEDIAQEVFIEVFLSISEFREDALLSTWIYRITVNKSLNFLRKKGRRKIFELVENLGGEKNGTFEESVSGNEFSPDNEIKRSEQQKAISQALDRLNKKQRIAFILSKYDDLSYEEIAKVMQTSVSSVESLIFRAKQNLQRSLYKFYKKNIL